MIVRRLAATVAWCAAAAALGWGLFGTLPGRGGAGVGPIAQFPDHIDLGDRRPNEAVTATLSIANTGDRPLVIDQITSSCSCAGLEMERDGRSAQLLELTVPPGQQAGPTFRLAVGVPPGEAQRVVISFRTNDSRQPAGRVVATVSRVVGQPSAVPAELAFGTVGLGAAAAEAFTIRANAVPGLRVVRAVSSRPERLTVAAEPGDADSVARLRVGLATADPGEVAGEVTVELAAADGSPHVVRVPVSARVRRPVEPAPAHLLMPAGRTEAESVLVGAGDEPFTATVVATPPGLTAATAAEPPLGGRFQVRLSVRGRAAGTHPVRLLVTPRQGPPFPLEVLVSCPAAP